MISQILSVSSHALYRQLHTQSFYDLTLGIGIAALPYRRHYILTLWNQSTNFMISHPLYFTSYWRYFRHIHSIDDITPILFMRSHPLYMSTSYPLSQQHIHYIFSIWATVHVSQTQLFHHITPFEYMTLHTLYV